MNRSPMRSPVSVVNRSRAAERDMSRRGRSRTPMARSVNLETLMTVVKELEERMVARIREEMDEKIRPLVTNSNENLNVEKLDRDSIDL